MTSKIRKSARGQACTLRLAPKCSDTDTTVLAHAPCRDKGTGFKSPDWWGAFACFACHDLIDKRDKIESFDFGHGGGFADRRRYLRQDEIDAAWLRGIYETQRQLIQQGLM